MKNNFPPNNNPELLIIKIDGFVPVQQCLRANEDRLFSGSVVLKTTFSLKKVEICKTYNVDFNNVKLSQKQYLQLIRARMVISKDNH